MYLFFGFKKKKSCMLWLTFQSRKRIYIYIVMEMVNDMALLNNGRNIGIGEKLVQGKIVKK